MVARDPPGDFSFWGNDPGGYGSLEMRRRIVAQMMANSGKKGHPKNIGEGLSAIGDSIGEIAMWKALQQQEAVARAERERDVAAIADSTPAAAPTAAPGPRADVEPTIAEPAPVRTAALPPPEEPVTEPTPAPVVAPPMVEPPAPSVARSFNPGTVPNINAPMPGANSASAITASPHMRAPWLDPTVRQYFGPPNMAAGNYVPSPNQPDLQRNQIAAQLTPNQRVAGGFEDMPNTADPRAAGRLAYSFDRLPPPARPELSGAAAPMSPQDAAQARTLAETTGMPGGPTGAYSYAPLASRGDPGGTLSDAPPLTGVSPRVGAAVGDTSQQIRDAISRRMIEEQTPTAPEVPQPNPTQAGALPPMTSSPSTSVATTGSPPDQRLAQAPGTVTDIQPAPRVAVPPPVVPPPAGAAPPPAYQMERPEPPPLPKRMPKSDRERQAERLLLTREDPQTRAAATFVLQQEKTKRDEAFAIEHEQYKARMQHYTAQQGVYETFQREREQRDLELRAKRNEIAKQAHELNQLPLTQQQEAYARQQEAEKRAQEIVTAKDKAADQARFGRDPEKFFAQFEKDKASAASSSATLESNRLALDAIRKGVITGSLADMRLNSARFRAWAFDNGLKGDEAANTQILRSAMTNALGSAVRTINGEGGVGVSNTDVKLAAMASGADPNLELSAIDQLLRTSNRINARKLNDYEDKHDYYLRGHRAEKDFAIPVGETAPPAYTERLLKNKDSAEAKAEYDKRFGDGAADLEIARAKRRERRGG